MTVSPSFHSNGEIKERGWYYWYLSLGEGPPHQSHNSVFWGGCASSMVGRGPWAKRKDCMRLVPNMRRGISQLLLTSLGCLVRLFLRMLEQLQTGISYCYWVHLLSEWKSFVGYHWEELKANRREWFPTLLFSYRFPLAPMINSLTER